VAGRAVGPGIPPSPGATGARDAPAAQPAIIAITRGAVPAIVGIAVDVMLAVMVGGARVLDRVRPARRPGERSVRVPPVVVPIVRGVVLAVPLVAAFGLLFAAADAVFADAAATVFDAWFPLDLGGAGRVTVEIAAAAWVAGGLLVVAAFPRLTPGLGMRALSPTGPVGIGAIAGWVAPAPATRDPRRLIGPVEATTVLALLDLLFAGFVALQLAYLFGGRDTLAAIGLTYAEYARRGFFELVVVAAMVMGVVAGLDLAVARRSRGQAVASLVLLALTGLVLASALERLRLYQAAYGWTELRLVVLVTIGWLAAALVATGTLLVRRRTGWLLHVLGVLALLAVAGLNVVGPQAFVAERNLERALDPSRIPPGGRTGLDADYVAGLGDEAVPATVAALDRLAPADQSVLEAFLADRATALREDPSLAGWPAYNLARERARAALGGR
jgi:hypothetical protein